MKSNNFPLVSIIITSYNHEKYLDECIQSILNQNYHDLEIIIIDNCSLDNSKEIIQGYAQLDKRIKFFPQEINLYPSDAMNLGIEICKGEYISLISGDDYCSLCRVETQLNYMLEHNLSNLFSWINVVNDSSEVLKEHPFNGLFNRNFTADEISRFLLCHGNTLCAGSVLLHRSIFERYGKFDARLLQLQDYEMWLRIASNEKLNILDEKLFNYRVRNDNKNLSLDNENNTALFRTNFETIYVAKQISSFNNDFLSKILNKPCNDISKYKNLLEFYIENNKKEFASGVLLVMFEELDKLKAEKSTELYSDFLSKYSSFDFTGTVTIQEKEQQIQQKEQQIQEKEQQVAYWHNLAHSLRLKNRLKRIAKKILPSRIWNILKYIKNNPKTIQKSIYIVKTQGFKSLFSKVLNASDGNRFEGIAYRYLAPILDKNIKQEIDEFQKKPLISIVMPVYNVDTKWLDLAIRSIEAQWYENWELCIADDKSTNSKTIEYLQNIKNSKIKVKFLENNLNISGATNEALTIANGEYIALMDNDDEITPDALYEVIKAINDTGAEFIYSDEDSIMENGTFTIPHFKPDFSPDLLLTHNYITHFSVLRKELINKVGGLRSQYDGAQDHDLFLRIAEVANSIYHIPKILYHWRIIPTSTNSNPHAKPKAMENAREVLVDTLKRRNIKGAVEHLTNMPYFFRVKRDLVDTSLVSIIIPFKDKPELLKMCIESIVNKSTYKNYEIIGISNNSTEQETFDEMKRLETLDSRIKFYEYNVPFNYSKINNYAVNTYAQGEHILLLNNDIEIISQDWIESMLEHSQRKEIGCVGAKLYFPDNTIQHAGVIVGIGGVAGHAHKCFSKNNVGYFNRASIIQNFSAVTAACLMVKKTIYEEVEGLNEEDLKIAFNDVDFCLRIQEKGYRNIFTPFAEAYHHESISRGYEDSPEKIQRFKKEESYMKERHKNILKKGDPYYNQNLTLDREDFSLR